MHVQEFLGQVGGYLNGISQRSAGAVCTPLSMMAGCEKSPGWPGRTRNHSMHVVVVVLHHAQKRVLALSVPQLDLDVLLINLHHLLSEIHAM